MEWQDRQRIELAARLRVQRLGKERVDDEDREIAQRDLHFWWSYMPAAMHKLVGPSVVHLGSRERRACRYCMRGEPEVSFKNKSHALPEFLGNRTLIDPEECDACNKRFSETCEDHLDKLTLPFRTMAAIRGKNGVPNFKDVRHGMRIDFCSSEQAFEIVTDGPNDGWVVDEVNNQITVKLRPYPHVPLEAFRCLVKMGYAIAPASCRPNLDRVRSWLVDPTRATEAVGRWALCLYAFFPTGFPEPWALLLERKKADGRSPHLLFIVASASHLWQVAMPLSLRDRHLEDREDIYMPHFDAETHFSSPGMTWERLPLCSTKIVRDPTLVLDVSFESVESLAGDLSPELLRKFESLQRF